ncbi:hypothetical protein KFE80_03395 [bacterium SCSIO 12696]|nr:hypothetical protein KFE80_03395 [bacterium SCSIO 12696]
MKTPIAIIGFLVCFVSGAVVHKVWLADESSLQLAEQVSLAKDTMDSLNVGQESQRVRILNAIVDNIRVVWNLDVSGADKITKIKAYEKALLHLSEDIKQAGYPKYSNRYSVDRAFDRANELIKEIGGDLLLDPDS